jgi:hypothetical protein
MCSSECGYNKKSIYFKNIHIKSKYNKLKLQTYTITIINEKIYFNFIIKGRTLWSLMPFQIIKDCRPIYGFFYVWSFLLDLFARWRALQPSKIIKNIACIELMWCELCSVQDHLPLFVLPSQFCFWFPCLVHWRNIMGTLFQAQI